MSDSAPPLGLDDLEDRLGNRPASLGGGDFLLVIGDEGALFGRLSAGELAESWFCPNARLDQGRALFARLLASRRRASVLVLADVLEQMYREDHLPRVGPLDRTRLLRRRLDMAYPGDSLKGAMTLGESGGGKRVLMAVLAESSLLSGWSAFLEGLANPVRGYCLLPLECVGLLDRLMPGDGSVRHWRALICQQAGGGLRQIVTLDGRLVITRLTQPPADSALLVPAMERELKSSVSYLKRLGYAESERLDLTLLAAEDACGIARQADWPVSRLTALTPEQAARDLGLGGAARGRGGFSDLLLAEWAARRKMPALILPTRVLAERARARRLIGLGQMAALAATVGVALFIGGLLSTSVESALSEKTLSARLASLSRPPVPSQSLPLPAADMGRAGLLADDWGRRHVDLAALLAALPADAAQRQVTFQSADGRPEGQAGAAENLPPARWELAVSYDLGARTPLEDQLAHIRDLKTRLAAAFPDCRVRVARLPLGFQPGQELDGELGQAGPPPERDSLLILSIRKENG